ncbi:hypothetical protein CFP65_3676 [Kitasatospora sp. MMS16-BH015]|uniref:alpha/beta fold hydrolase n=1 Tax=Kitasatospora sp. MMS16-BH015 TaxID=2018025 RepID=UPI000CA288D6|nr:alpha/beta hydrolase [Kitasatospora sp. MMS16-BH015]AUG78464.1 hypothetical protein CFP65_3676 [Kitasatospora sp. MMS16-BH015]
MSAAPVTTQFAAPDGGGDSGSGTRHAVVLSPAMAVWDEGAFFAPVTELLLAAGYRVTVCDTLSLLAGESAGASLARIGQEPGAVLRGLADRWAAVVAGLGPVDLIGGAALGGATALALLSRPELRARPALLLSAPCRADGLLDARLGEIAALAADGRLGAAYGLLERYVTPEGASAGPAVPAVRDGAVPSAGAERIAQGLGLLRGLDLTKYAHELTGRQLHLYGESSQLVGLRHAVPGRHPQISAVAVPGAGMRPQYDSPEFVARAVREFLAALEGLEGVAP